MSLRASTGPASLLGRNEVRGAGNGVVQLAGQLVARVHQRPRQAHVEHFQGAVLGENQVRGLDVAVNEPAPVRVPQPGRGLRNVPRGLRVVQPPGRFEHRL
jgi:hypothetical protein